MSSMLSAPASIPCTNDITLRPGNTPPVRPDRSTASLTNRSTPSRPARLAGSTSPAFATARSSSNTTRSESSFTAGCSSFTMQVTC